MTLTERLAEWFACFTGVWIQSFEHDDALAEMASFAAKSNGR